MSVSNTTMLIRKVGKTAKIDIENIYGISVLEEPMLFATEVKETGSRDWVDEHGLDVYDAGTAYFKDFDVDIQFGAINSSTYSCQQRYKAFLEFLTTNGILHDIYCPWIGMGRTNVRYKGSSDFVFERQNGVTYMTFKMKFNIADPTTEVNEF